MSVQSRKLSKLSGYTQTFSLTRESLAMLKLKAVRKGCWFIDLKHEERMLLELTMRVVKRVHIFLLAKIVSRIVSKLCEAMESVVYRLMRSKGQGSRGTVGSDSRGLGK